ncbi:MAG: alcohol dehydrogenase catalytic domain-containing protein [Chitinivibrionales bacterium]|nr:alcohol dehydrogenase catalytic domain-containing protein [Chitinivibrionales bacterium]
MKAVFFNDSLQIRDIDLPQRLPGEALVKVLKAGICNTDHEITHGYMPGFAGILGHEFIGLVADADTATWINRRVTAEINLGCGDCGYCTTGLSRHCPQRTVLGIQHRNGCMAQYLTVPEQNLVAVPDAISDDEAVFIEPLAAACEILEQLTIDERHSVLLLGDGKLALLIAHVIASTGARLDIVGKHPQKLALVNNVGDHCYLKDNFKRHQYDIVIESTGNAGAFRRALHCTKPRGHCVLKSTYTGKTRLDAAHVVVNEITLLGSRCGRFADAINFMQHHHPPLTRYISGHYRLSRAVDGFAASLQPHSLKIILDCTR